MPRYIDADALGIGYANPKVFNSEEYARGWNSAIEIINSAPTVSPDEVRGAGKWMKTDAFPHRVYCSNCFKTIVPNEEYAFWSEGIMPRNYCPSCGAKMEVTSDA